MISNKLKWIIKNIIGETTTDRLIKRGLTVGDNFSRQGECFIDNSHCWLIDIGSNVTFSKRVIVLAHDASTIKLLGYVKVGKVKISDNVFVGANVTILPGVTIGKNSIIGAGSVVTKDIPANVVAAGNPAEVMCEIEEYRKKHTLMIKDRPVYDKSYTLRGGITAHKKKTMKKELSGGIGYIP
ncbi:acyltransferase [Guptibacillus hwajinpoensis]|uniref:acyltransferase n=1 Tax=Guptibacillus hwajinpoensis TaxID=208199 RepID=UPI003CFF7655